MKRRRHSSYRTLNEQILYLFCQIWPKLSAGKIVGKKQEGEGSFHSTKDFTKLLNEASMDWDMIIAEFKRRLRERRSVSADNKKADNYCGNERQP